MTAWFTVRQPHPSSMATSLTLRANRPTWNVTHNAARVVRSWRGEAMRWSSSVHEPISQSGSGQHHRRLCHTRQMGRPETGRSTSSTRGRSLIRATTPHLGHPIRSTLVSTWILPMPPRSILDGEERDIGKSDHPLDSARRVSLHGGPPSSVVEQPKTGGPPLRARGSDYCTPLIFEEPRNRGEARSEITVIPARPISAARVLGRRRWASDGRVPKRELWAKLLRSALGLDFEDSDELFIEHTYLDAANLIGHAVVGFDLNSTRNDPGVLLSGQLFEPAGSSAWVRRASSIGRSIALPGPRWFRMWHGGCILCLGSGRPRCAQGCISRSSPRRCATGWVTDYTPDWLADLMVTEA